MKSSAKNIRMTNFDDLFSAGGPVGAGRDGGVREISLTELYPFKDHPFKVLDDESMQETVESIKAHGVLVTHNGSSGDTIYLQPMFDGAHVDQADAVDPAKITYRIRKNPFAGDQVTLIPISVENGKKAAKIEVDSSVDTNGTIVVEVAYTTGGVTKRATRAIFVKVGTAEGDIKIDGGGVADITIAKTVDEEVTKTFTMSGLNSGSSVPTWSLTANAT